MNITSILRAIEAMRYMLPTATPEQRKRYEEINRRRADNAAFNAEVRTRPVQRRSLFQAYLKTINNDYRMNHGSTAGRGAPAVYSVPRKNRRRIARARTRRAWAERNVA